MKEAIVKLIDTIQIVQILRFCMCWVAFQLWRWHVMYGLTPSSKQCRSSTQIYLPIYQQIKSMVELTLMLCEYPDLTLSKLVFYVCIKAARSWLLKLWCERIGKENDNFERWNFFLKILIFKKFLIHSQLFYMTYSIQRQFQKL